jgi:hypothetical protein
LCLSDADGSWEDRKKYRKSKESVQHWVNISVQDSVHESSDQVFLVPTEQVEMSLCGSDRKLASCDDLPEVTSCLQEHQNNSELCSTSSLKKPRNVDSVCGCPADHTDGELDQILFITQEKQPTEQTRSVVKSVDGCSKSPDSDAETLLTDKKTSRTRHDFVSCNKTPVSRKKILEPAGKDTTSTKQVSLRSCDHIGALINEEHVTGVLRIERTWRNCSDSPAVRKEDCSVEDIKSTRKWVIENCGKGPTAMNIVLPATDLVLTSDAGAECANSLISGKKTFTPGGTELLEVSNGSICKKGNLSITKEVPSHVKETLTHHDTIKIKRRLLFDIDHSLENSDSNPSLQKKKSGSSYRLEKNIDSCDTDPALRGETLLLSNRVAPVSGTESGMGCCVTRQKKLLFSDTGPSVSGTRRNAHSYSNSPTAGKAEVVSCVHYTTMSGTETSVGNFYTIPSTKKECASLLKTKVNLRDYSDDPTVRKKVILTLDEQDSASATEEILKNVDCSSLSVKDKALCEDGESLECVKGVRNDRQKQSSAAGHLVNNEIRDSLDRRKCHGENPACTTEHTREEIVASKSGNLQNSKSRKSYIQIEGKENFSSTSVSLRTSDEDCVDNSLEDASTVIIYPLLSCRFENEVSKIRQKLKNVHESVMDKDRSPLENHDTGKQIMVLT